MAVGLDTYRESDVQKNRLLPPPDYGYAPTVPSSPESNSMPSYLAASRSNFLDNCEAPTYWHGVLAYLADVTPSQKLVNTPVAPQLKNRDKNLARIATYNFLNNSLAPVCNTRRDRTFNNNSGTFVERLDTCIQAEDTLMITFESMENAIALENELHPRPTENFADFGWTIVVDHDIEPIAIKKHIGQPSALSLVPLAIDGYTFPAGSLLRMRLHEYPAARFDDSFLFTKAVTPVENVKSIKFLRLSAYAHDPEERLKIFKRIDHEDPFASLTLEQIADLTRDCIPLSTYVQSADSDAQQPLIPKNPV